jgi:hypothetical protein
MLGRAIVPIKAKCRKCSKVYTVKDELAGKKFRCKQCQTPVTVPQPAVILEEEPEPEEDLFGSNDDFGGDDFGSFGDDFGDDYGEPVRPKKRKKKPAPKKKRRKKKSSGPGIGAKIGGLFGAAIGVLFVIGFVFRIINAAGGLDLGTSWKSYTTPDGNVTVLMPGTASTVPNHSMAPGGQSYGASGRNFGCAITIEPMVGQLAGMSEDELFNAFEFGSGMMGASNVERTTLNGKSAIKFDALKAGIKSENIAFVHKDKVYTMNYMYKGVKGSKGSKYFNSMKLN